MDDNKIELIEVFSSFQGEGFLAGYRQVFVRLANCNLNCSYCDTAASQKTCAWAQIEETAGRGDFKAAKNPVSVHQLAGKINNLLLSAHHSVSLTGGEPLCQASSLARLAAKINAPLYLETNGTLPQMLDLILDKIKYVSMDIKLPSVLEQSYWQQHSEFLQKAVRAQKAVFVKIVITAETTAAEMKTAADLIAAVSPKIPLAIQPVTLQDTLKPLAFAKVMPFWEIAAEKIGDVRIIPQMHKILGVI